MGAQWQTRPIIIVTGANAGVGFSICHRLLVQLAYRSPSDALPQSYALRRLGLEDSANTNGAADLEGLAGCDALTLVLACRNVQKAEAARKELLRLLDIEIEKVKRARKYDGHAEQFRKNLNVVIRCLDLASLDSTFKFARQISSEFSYISHFICNAGAARFSGMDFVGAIRQLFLESFVAGVTNPKYKLQRVGDLSEDGLGYIWQSNLFGHYLLYRLLKPLLAQYISHCGKPARVLWSSSVEAAPFDFDLTDLQLVRSTHPYEVSKFELELLVGHLELQQQQYLDNNAKAEQLPVRHILYDPGIVRSNMAVSALNNVLLEWLMQVAFLIAHLLGSRSHVMVPYKSAVAAVHLVLVGLPFISQVSSSGSKKPPTPLRYTSKVDFWFNETTGAGEVREWDERTEQAAKIAEGCDSLYQSILQKRDDDRKYFGDLHRSHDGL